MGYLFNLFASNFSKLILKGVLIIFTGLALIDVVRFYNLFNDARMESQNLMNYLMPYAENITASTTGLAAPPEEVRGKVQEAFRYYVRSMYPDSKYSVREDYADNDFIVFQVLPVTGMLDKNSERFHGEIRIQLMFKVTDPFTGKYKIGAGYRRDLVSSMNLGRSSYSWMKIPVTSVRIQELQQGYTMYN